MATLVLTAAGAALGGPVGGAIGALIGQQADRRLFAPPARRGPQLGELAVQTSSYGSELPKIFGRMRVAGTVIWSTDLQERRSTAGGKGKPKSVSYSYSASFAVALSARSILRVGRIWADGKLLRGEAGDFKSATRYRLYLGDEEQGVDPLIASIEGAGQAPAYRGLAYALFEDFELADYGNRIPSLSFEVEADAGPVTIGQVAQELSDGEIRAGGTPLLTGYAAGGESVRGALEELSAAAGLSLAEQEGALVLDSLGTAPIPIGKEELIGRGPEISRSASASIAAEVTLAYYDPERDFQTGLQRAARGTPALRSERRTLPAALSAEAAKALAAQRLRSLWAGRESAVVRLPWKRAGLRPASVLRLEGRAGLWQADRVGLERTAVTLELRQVSWITLPMPVASSGRPIGYPDVPHGPTTMLLLDMPLTSDQLPARPQLFLAAAGVEAGWRYADLSVSYDNGQTWEPAGRTAAAAVLGTALSVPGAAGAALVDEHSTFDVELLNEDMWLESRSDADLANGANLAALGDELIQFGRVEPLGDRRFRLSRLLRGRRGTEWAAATHATGEGFALLEASALAVIEPSGAYLGGEARVVANGLGDDPGADAVIRLVTGESVRPPRPVHLSAKRLPNDDLAIQWVRRSRNGWHWLDERDTPLGEEREAYRLTLTTSSSRRVVELAEPAFVYSAAQQLADGAGRALTLEVEQIGTAATSRTTTLLMAD